MNEMRSKPRPRQPERPRKDDRKSHPIDPPPENDMPVDEPDEERRRRDDEQDKDQQLK